MKKYSVRTAPRRVRLKWLKKARRTRALCAKSLARLRVKIGGGCAPCTTRASRVIRPRKSSSPFTKARSEQSVEDWAGYVSPRREQTVEEYAGYLPSKNPELMIVHNPHRRFHRTGSTNFMVRHRRHRRVKARNTIRVRIGGQRRSYRSFIKYLCGRKRKGRKITLKRAAAIWRRSKKCRSGKCPKRKRRIRRCRGLGRRRR